MRDLTDQLSRAGGGRTEGRVSQSEALAACPKTNSSASIAELEKQMKEAAKNLEFEKAAAMRDEMYELRRIFRQRNSLSLGKDPPVER